jgi:hypothetical protein
MLACHESILLHMEQLAWFITKIRVRWGAMRQVKGLYMWPACLHSTFFTVPGPVLKRTAFHSRMQHGAECRSFVKAHRLLMTIMIMHAR